MYDRQPFSLASRLFKAEILASKLQNGFYENITDVASRVKIRVIINRWLTLAPAFGPFLYNFLNYMSIENKFIGSVKLLRETKSIVTEMSI